MDILKITVTDLRNGKYKNIFPDLYALKGLSEKNPVHDNQDIFEHSLSVYQEMSKLLAFPPLKEPQLGLFKQKLLQKVDKLTRKKILLWLALFHDIGKLYTLTKSVDGVTICLDHGEFGAAIFNKENSHLTLSKKEKETITHLIKYHELIDSVTKIYEQRKEKELLKIFADIVGDWAGGLSLLMLADWEGLDVKLMNPAFYQKRKKTIKEMINYFFQV